jgi:hypothetical protein
MFIKIKAIFFPKLYYELSPKKLQHTSAFPKSNASKDISRFLAINQIQIALYFTNQSNPICPSSDNTILCLNMWF